MVTKEDVDSASQYSQKLELITRPLLNYTASRIFNYQSAEDIVQETILILCKKKNQFDPNKSFYSWAFKICNFQIKKHLTLVKRKREDCYGLSREYDSIKESTPSPAFFLSKKESLHFNKETIKTLKNKLPPKQSEAFKYFLLGFSRKKICSLMNMKSGALNITYYRLLKNSEKILKDAQCQEN